MKLLSQMTEEELKTLCNSLKNDYTNKSTITLKQVDFDNMWKTIDKQSNKIEELLKELEFAKDAIYEYIQIHGVERKCSKYLAKYAKKTK